MLRRFRCVQLFSINITSVLHAAELEADSILVACFQNMLVSKDDNPVR